MNAKLKPKKEVRIVIANMDEKVYEAVKKIAEEDERKIGKMAELLLKQSPRVKKLLP